MSPKIVDKDDRRARILDAAIRAFARDGFHATRTEDVAREAGVANGTVYLYFGSRDEIFAAAFARFTERVSGAVDTALAAPDPPLERLRGVVRAMLANTQAEPELSRLVLDFGAHRRSEAFDDGARPDFGAIYRGFRETLAELLTEAERAGEVRTGLAAGAPAVIIGAVEGIVLQWIVDPEAVSPTATADVLLDVLIDGLRGPR